jgi:signal transduction histidine kinase
MRERDEMREIARIADEVTEQKDLGHRLPVNDGSDAVGQLTATLNAMLDRLERAYMRERRFLSEASHELRTPITVCRANLELLAADPAGVDPSATITLVVDELVRMTRIVEDMTTLARMEHPTFLRPERVDLAGLIDEVAAKAQALLGDRLRTGPVPHGATIEADPQRLTQALLNLLENARLHATGDSEVRIELREAADTWRVDVSDDGGGLPPGREEELFEPFRRGTSRRSGSGLGLAIVRAVALAHGGTAGVDNRPSEGATFWIMLPRVYSPGVARGWGRTH